MRYTTLTLVRGEQEGDSAGSFGGGAPTHFRHAHWSSAPSVDAIAMPSSVLTSCVGVPAYFSTVSGKNKVGQRSYTPLLVLATRESDIAYYGPRLSAFGTFSCTTAEVAANSRGMRCGVLSERRDTRRDRKGRGPCGAGEARCWPVRLLCNCDSVWCSISCLRVCAALSGADGVCCYQDMRMLSRIYCLSEHIVSQTAAMLYNDELHRILRFFQTESQGILQVWSLNHELLAQKQPVGTVCISL